MPGQVLVMLLCFTMLLWSCVTLTVTCPLHSQLTTGHGSSPYRPCSLETGPAHNILRTTLRYTVLHHPASGDLRLGGFEVLRLSRRDQATMHHNVTAVQSQLPGWWLIFYYWGASETSLIVSTLKNTITTPQEALGSLHTSQFLCSFTWYNYWCPPAPFSIHHHITATLFPCWHFIIDHWSYTITGSCGELGENQSLDLNSCLLNWFTPLKFRSNEAVYL